MTEKKDPRAYELFGESPDNDEGNRPCPVCGNIMEVTEFKGFKIETCEEHGNWLDKGKLEKIIRKKSRRGSAQRKLREFYQRVYNR